jgi:predicted DNA-binding protein (MmcQ/YjbR family)
LTDALQAASSAKSDERAIQARSFLSRQPIVDGTIARNIWSDCGGMWMSTLLEAEETLRRYALALPGAHEEFPWDERVIKVNRKIFVFLGMLEPDLLRVTVKLPTSGNGALNLPFTQPTGYGLGQHGWVTARLSAADEPPVGLLQDWILESYRAIALKRLVAQLR